MKSSSTSGRAIAQLEAIAEPTPPRCIDLMTLELFPFRYRDARTGKWVHARYRATVEEIDQRYKIWEITGAPDIRVGNA